MENTAVTKMETMSLQHDILNARAVISRLLETPVETLHSRDFLLEQLKSFGCMYQGWRRFAPFQEYLSSSKFGPVQVPTEYVDFLCYCIDSDIESFIEIGVLYGGFSIFTCAVLSRLKPGLKYYCVDIEDNFIDWDHYSHILPLTKNIPCTSADFSGQSFDVVFIDGDHSYHGMKRDFVNLGRYAKICGFHDIKGAEYDKFDGGTRGCWQDIKVAYREKFRVIEISHMPDDWMGIGIIDFR